jgi:hypothetical protein
MWEIGGGKEKIITGKIMQQIVGYTVSDIDCINL